MPTSPSVLPTEPAIQVTNLTVALGGYTIIDDISCTIPAGQTTAIIGPNGAGKSVFLKAILRLVPKQSGTVSIFGTPHESYRSIASLVSYIPQKLSFDRSFPLTVEGLFALKSSHWLGFRASDRERMEELLKRVGMDAFRHRQLRTLSGGQMQRVLLGFSLLDRPKLLILDEPSAGIDVQGQETIYNLLHRIQEQEHLTLVLVSHELEVVMRYANQVLCLNHQLLCAGVPHEVLSNEMLEKMYGDPVSHFTHTHPH